MYKSDCHLHTNFSPDSQTEMEDMIKKAIELGLDEIILTDHVDFDYPATDILIPVEFDEKKYHMDIDNCREKYSDKIKIGKGIELGVQPHIAKDNSDFVNQNDFDFVISSSHAADKLDLYNGDFFRGKERLRAYELYFLDILKNVAVFDNFDVYGHLDYVNRYGNYRENNLDFCHFREYYKNIFKVLIDKGKGIEINTSGFRYGLNTFHPQIEALKLYKEMGGEIITIGSDAHSPDNVYYGVDIAISAAAELGFKYACSFSKRKPVYYKI